MVKEHAHCKCHQMRALARHGILHCIKRHFLLSPISGVKNYCHENYKTNKSNSWSFSSLFKPQEKLFNLFETPRPSFKTTPKTRQFLLEEYIDFVLSEMTEYFEVGESQLVNRRAPAGQRIRNLYHTALCVLPIFGRRCKGESISSRSALRFVK